ncbi:hypothetical protein GCM10025734_06210 [Kitasatospora paranensis]
MKDVLRALSALHTRRGADAAQRARDLGSAPDHGADRHGGADLRVRTFLMRQRHRAQTARV